MLKVLVVDDSLIIRKTLTKLLEELGHIIIGEASNGQECFDLYCKLKPDLVTLDITMPIMNGIVSLKKIKEFDDNAKVIMITSHGEENFVMEAIKIGARGYILKPINEDKLKESLNKLFESA